jgi:hypothetical protein
MLEALVEKLILSYFGDFIENLDRKKLNVGVSNIKLKKFFYKFYPFVYILIFK